MADGQAQESDVNALNVIHIAGTKGKGSTCAFVDSFLRTHGKRTGFPSKVGLYTSPHLIYPEERIRINFKPLPRESLAKYFFEIYDKLPQIASEPDSTKPPVQRGPRYLQLWALLALHTFIREEVDAVVLETHNGGENDATNVIAKPLVTAITTLGLDHVAILGPTIENVAWHKAGIFKREAVALSTTQVPQTIEILQQRARQVGQDVGFVDLDSRLPVTSRNLEPSVQRKNASLAAAAAQAFLQRTGSQDISVDDLRNGVERWSWPGRYQILPRGAQTWFLDAAHCELSVTLAVEWFAQESPALVSSGEIVNRVLVFSHLNKLRDSIALLEKLISALEESNIALHHVIFTTYNETTEDPAGVPENLTTFKQVWQHRFPSTPVWAEATIQRAIGLVHRLSDGVKNTHILVTGSQYLVGPSLHLLQTQGQHDLGPDAKADHILAQ